ncbi:hypothetical protein ACFYST_08325 [Kitasatospora sp. NPDC004614]|uniref:hypothetical protein n=1 Tax=unclassified Kitasatospora TaxID=2633591 RepID=UPI0036C93D7F
MDGMTAVAIVATAMIGKGAVVMALWLRLRERERRETTYRRSLDRLAVTLVATRQAVLEDVSPAGHRITLMIRSDGPVAEGGQA